MGKHLTEKLNEFVSIPHEKIQTIKLKPFERFFFLSTYGNMASHENDELVLKANLGDLISVLNQTNFANGLKSFLFVSTSSVNLQYQTMYSRTKKAAEQVLLSFAEKYNAPVCIVRPFSVTGIGEQKEHLIPTLIRSAMTGEEMPLVPDAVHDFIDVDDIVDGLLTLSARKAKGIFELGTGVGVENETVKYLVEKVTGKKIKTRIVRNMRPYDNGDWISTNMSARRFGWQPKKTLEQSITEMVEAYERT